MLEELLNQIPQQNADSLVNTTKLTDKELDYLYNLGVRAFKLNNYTQALPLFQMIVAYDSTNTTYIKALAGCLQAQKEFLSAHFTYKMAYTMNSTKNDDCLFYSGVCLYELGQMENATQEFNNFIEKTKNKELSLKAQLYLNGINKH